MEIKLKRLSEHAKLPKVQHLFDGGADVFSTEKVSIPPGGRAAIGLGFAMEIPEDYEMMVRPRSGLAIRNGVTVLNTPGLIDAGYRDENKVILINHGDTTFNVEIGDRIAQFSLKKVVQMHFYWAEELTNTDRTGGFGSTGVR